jgi:hypothetical protein
LQLFELKIVLPVSTISGVTPSGRAGLAASDGEGAGAVALLDVAAL